ncbi:hypothetical protein EDC94DRAFT_437722 [Helicostylum pulchrum]|nr:hypothetical protein EDC94DRAFT_437722 [Helicostylum pulchrum]
MRGYRGNVRVTNGQTCVYCFQHLEHPLFIEEKDGKIIRRYTKGSLICINPGYVSVKHGRATKSRDVLSSLAIDLSGLSSIVLGAPIPCFSPTKISVNQTLRNSKQTHLPSLKKRGTASCNATME